MVVLWLVVAAGGLTVATVASTRSVEHTLHAAAGLRVPVYIVGFTLLAVGTDVPEIANSIAASVSGHGDVNVGDSIGSALTQSTIVLGLVPFAAGTTRVTRHNVALLGFSSVVMLLLATTLFLDGRLGRIDGAVLLAAWAGATVFVWRRAQRPKSELPQHVDGTGRHVVGALGWLVVVGIGATVAVAGIVAAAELLDVPEFVLSFVGLALGTSLPELTVAVTAARQGRGDLAIGDVLGATLADASLSLGSGPLIAPVAITVDLAVRSSLVAASVVAVVTVLLALAGRHDRATGFVLVLVYMLVLPFVLRG